MYEATIKEVTESEIEICAAVIRNSFATVAEEFGLTKENCPTNGAFIEKERLAAEKQKGKLMYALHYNKTIIGFVALADNQNGTYILEKLSVLPEYRHNSFGKKLLTLSIEKVKSLKGSKIIIGIIEENTRLKNWYTTNGFQHIGTKIIPSLPFVVGYMELNL